MKYLYRNNVSIFFRDRKKFIIVFYLITLGVFLGYKYLGNPVDQDFLLDVLGLHPSFENGVLPALIGIFNIGWFIFIVINLFNLENHYVIDAVFLRMKIGKWGLLQLLNLLWLDFIFLIIIYLCLIFIYSIQGGIIQFSLFGSYFVFQYLFLLGVQLISLLFYLGFYKYPKVIMFLCLIVIWIVFQQSFTYETFKKYDLWILLFDIILLILNDLFMIKNKELLFYKMKGSIQ